MGALAAQAESVVAGHATDCAEGPRRRRGARSGDRAIRQALGVCRDDSRDECGRSIEQAEEVKCRLRAVNHPVPNNKQDF
ncbi:hypothetical protein ACRS8P_01115 [Burkholderia cenocepacia]